MTPLVIALLAKCLHRRALINTYPMHCAHTSFNTLSPYWCPSYSYLSFFSSYRQSVVVHHQLQPVTLTCFVDFVTLYWRNNSPAPLIFHRSHLSVLHFLVDGRATRTAVLQCDAVIGGVEHNKYIYTLSLLITGWHKRLPFLTLFSNYS